MAVLQVFDCFVVDLIGGAHNLLQDDLRLILTNIRPVKELTSVKSIKEVSANRNYKTGGKQVKLREARSPRGIRYFAKTDIHWTRRYKDPLGPFQFVVFYNATNGRLIGYYDYDNSVLLDQPVDKSFSVTLATNRDKRRRLLPMLQFGQRPRRQMRRM